MMDFNFEEMNNEFIHIVREANDATDSLSKTQCKLNSGRWIVNQEILNVLRNKLHDKSNGEIKVDLM